MTESLRLPASRLYRACDPESLSFETTRDLLDIDAIETHARAREALGFGIDIRHAGFNVFALGPTGTGKYAAVRAAVEASSRTQPVPNDWCYVNNFADPQKPLALSLPPGKGGALKSGMQRLVEELNSAIPAVLDNDDTHARMEQIEEEFRERRTSALESLRNEGQQHGIAVIETPAGFTFAPLDASGNVMSPEQFEKLSEEKKKEIQSTVNGLQEKLQKLVRQFQTWRKEVREQVKALHREIAEIAVGHMIDELRTEHSEHEEVLAYLDAVQQDVVEHVSDFLPQPELPFAMRAKGREPEERYGVNVIVDNSSCEGAPVVHEALPNYGNLIGRCEHQALMGTLVTSFMLIRGGALHRANGGYLLVDARKLLMQPFAWETLKRALQSREITLEPLERSLSLISTVGLEPQPIPIDVKVILMGDRFLYYLMHAYDPEFTDLFKVAADFDVTIDRTDERTESYSRLIASVGRYHSLRPLDRTAVARVIEEGARIAGEADKLTTHLRSLGDLMVEADHWAQDRGADTVAREDVERAVRARERRADRIRERVMEAIERGMILIDTQGAAVGQVNGLAVMQLGDYAFGHPCRITATTRLGEGEVVDIEREIEMGGPIHSKGVLILSSFLMSRYARHHPVSLAASLVFEQSYSGIEGDSASLAELCALLSSLSRLPIKQSLAITGSVDQHGRAQAIGGVNEKIEGFFEVCRERGLDGEHGVLVPASNVRDLMLRREVVEAVEAGRFKVYAVDSVDQAIEILTGVAAGAEQADGTFAAESVNGRVDAQLIHFAEVRQQFSHRDEADASTPTSGA